jgi:exopolyphosphatase/guanosine-5'-triphosphate,3'-diphosphate pyrophosphatase
MISQAAFVDIDHPGRVFLALTIFYRYEGEDDEVRPHELSRIVDDKALERAQVLSSVFRLAYILTAAMPGMLPKISLTLGTGKSLVLKVPRRFADLLGERVEKRLAVLAGQIGRAASLEIA